MHEVQLVPAAHKQQHALQAAYGPAMGAGAGPTAAEQQGTAGAAAGATLFEQPYIGAPLRDLVNHMHEGNLGHKMDDTDVHDMMVRCY